VPNRLVAYVLDALILTIAIFLVAAVVGAIAGPTIRIDAAEEIDVDDRMVVVNAVIGCALNAGYFIVSWTRLQASPGQRLLAIGLVSAADEASISIAQALVRWLLLGAPFATATVLGLAVPAAALVLMLAALAWYVCLLVTTARSPRKQGLHDRGAGTVVVKALPLAIGPAAASVAEAERVR